MKVETNDGSHPSTSLWKTPSDQTSFTPQAPSFHTDVQLEPSHIEGEVYSCPVQLEIIFRRRRYASMQRVQRSSRVAITQGVCVQTHTRLTITSRAVRATT